MAFWKQEMASQRPDSGESQRRESQATASARGGVSAAFRDLAESDLVRLFNAATVIKLAPADRLFGANDPADRIYVVTAGQVELRQSTEGPGERVGTGDCICDLDLEHPSVHETTAVALEPTSLLSLDRQALMALDPALKAYLMQRMQQRSLAQVRVLQREKSRLEQLNADLMAALYSVRTTRGWGFAQSEMAKQLFAKVPALPVSSVTLLNKMLDDRTTKTEIVSLVSMDPGLTSMLLKAVNSPLYGLVHNVTNVSHAIALLGHNIVYQIVMAESMRQSLPNKPVFVEIHQRAIELSRIAFVMSQTLGVGKPAEVATTGILSDIGLVVSELLKASNSRLSILFDLLDAAEMGAELLRSWSLPATLCNSLRYQDYPGFSLPDRIPTEIQPNIALLYLARRLYHRLHEAEEQPPGLFIDAYLEVLSQSGQSEKDLLFGTIVPRLQSQIRLLPKSLAERLQA
jgi:HD-like signal output (HDOD) protein/CRP-like cAMP-binding protein